MPDSGTVQPIPQCPALDGYHCQSSSLARMYYHAGHPLAEELIFGLGAGLGFIYWQQKGQLPFIGGRGNPRGFFSDLGSRTGVRIEVRTTTSERTAEERLLEKLMSREPAMLFGDMAYLPWFDLPPGYHFGAHTFVVCGYDGDDTVLASDIDPKASGLKRGFYASISRDELRRARGSKHKPYPPRNAALELDFTEFRFPGREQLFAAIRQVAAEMMNPPIRNLGIAGIRKLAEEIGRWPSRMSEEELHRTLFNLYVFIEIGGTGGGCFRHMHARFLQQVANTCGDAEIASAAAQIEEAGDRFTEVAELFRHADRVPDLDARIRKTRHMLLEIADVEEEGHRKVLAAVPVRHPTSL